MVNVVPLPGWLSTEIKDQLLEADFGQTGRRRHFRNLSFDDLQELLGNFTRPMNRLMNSVQGFFEVGPTRNALHRLNAIQAGHFYVQNNHVDFRLFLNFQALAATVGGQNGLTGFVEP
jgi:hypothetical protein